MDDHGDEEGFFGNFQDDDENGEENGTAKSSRKEMLKIIPNDPINIREENWFFKKEKKKAKELRSILSSHYYHKKYAECIELCNQILVLISNNKNNPKKQRNTEDLKEILAYSYIGTNNYEMALKNIDELILMTKNMNIISSRYFLKARCLFLMNRDSEGIELLEKTLHHNNKDVVAMVQLAEKYKQQKKYELSFYCLIKAKKPLCFNEDKKSTLWSFTNSEISSRFWDTYDFVKSQLLNVSPVSVSEEDVQRLKEHCFFGSSLLSINDMFQKDLNGITQSFDDNQKNLEERDPFTL